MPPTEKTKTNTPQASAGLRKTLLAYDPADLALLEEIGESLQDSWHRSSRRKGRKILEFVRKGQPVNVEIKNA